MQYTTQTITGNNFTITIHKPILDEGERKKREQELIKALEHFGKAKENNNANRKN